MSQHRESGTDSSQEHKKKRITTRNHHIQSKPLMDVRDRYASAIMNLQYGRKLKILIKLLERLTECNL